METAQHHFESIVIPSEQLYLLRSGEVVPEDGVFIRAHLHTQHEIMWFRRASGSYSINNQNFEIGDDTLVYVAPLVLHDMQLTATSDHQRFLFQYDQALLNDLGVLTREGRKCPSVVMHLQPADAERLQMLFTWMAELRTGGDPLINEVMRLILQFMHELLSREEGIPDSIGAESAASKILSVVRHMEKTRAYSMSLEEAASSCRLSRSQFAKVFKSVMDMTYTEYLLSRKISHAQHLLTRTDLSITEIAYACEFTDSAYFCHKFRVVVGVSPRTFRTHQRTTQQLSSQHDVKS